MQLYLFDVPVSKHFLGQTLCWQHIDSWLA